MVHTVTAGVDGSPESLAAAVWAGQEAARRNLPLRLLQVWEWLPSNPHFPLGPEEQRHWAEGRLRTAERELTVVHPELEITAEQIPGDPSELLLDAAAASDLLVLGSRGLGGLAGFLYGSVGLRVVAHAERPVVLVRATEASEAVHRGSVALGLDIRANCDPVVSFACEQALSRGGALRVLYVWNPYVAYGYAGAPIDAGLIAELQDEQKRALTETLAPWREAHPDLPIDEEVLHGSPGPYLTEAAAGADLLVVGRRQRTHGLGARLGHVAHGVLHHALCPVAVVPHE